LPDLGKNVVFLEKYTWRNLRDTVSTGSFNDNLRKLYGTLCEVMHGRRTVTRREAYAAFEETLFAVETLYKNHEL
jgi:hypothetical protein